jgi:chromosome segregation ATPase
LRLQVRQAEKRERHLLNLFSDLTKAPSFISSLQTALEALAGRSERHFEATLREKQSEVDATVLQLAAARADADARQRADLTEIERLKGEVQEAQALAAARESQLRELENQQAAAADRSASLCSLAERAQALEAAIRAHCTQYPFIAFDGSSLFYRTGTLAHESTLEVALETAQREGRRLSDEVKALKAQLDKTHTAYFDEVQALRKAKDREVSGIRAALSDAFRARDDAQAGVSRAEAQIEQLRRASATAERQLRLAHAENERLRAQAQDARDRESRLLARLEGPLAAVADGAPAQAPALPQIAVTADALLTEANEFLRGENASLTAALAAAQRRVAELADENATLVAERLRIGESLASEGEQRRRHEAAAGEWRQRHEALLMESRGSPAPAVTALEEEIGRLRGAHEDLAAVGRAKDEEIERLGATLARVRASAQSERARAREDHAGLTAQIERLVREREEPPREPPEIEPPVEDETRMIEEDEPEPAPRSPRKRARRGRKR